QESAEEWREKMLDAATQFDDELMEQVLEGKTPDEKLIIRALRKGTNSMKMFPVICGTAFKNKGVQTLLDAVVDYLPSPLDIPPVEGLDPDNSEKKLTRKA